MCSPFKCQFQKSRTVLKVEVEQQCPQSTKIYISSLVFFWLKTGRTFPPFNPTYHNLVAKTKKVTCSKSFIFEYTVLGVLPAKFLQKNQM